LYTSRYTSFPEMCWSRVALTCQQCTVHCVRKLILFSSLQVCGCYCKMFRDFTFPDTVYFVKPLHVYRPYSRSDILNFANCYSHDLSLLFFFYQNRTQIQCNYSNKTQYSIKNNFKKQQLKIACGSMPHTICWCLNVVSSRVASADECL